MRTPSEEEDHGPTPPTDKSIDDLVAAKKPEEILGEEGISKELTRRLVERAIGGETAPHLGYPPHAPESDLHGNRH